MSKHGHHWSAVVLPDVFHLVEGTSQARSRLYVAATSVQSQSIWIQTFEDNIVLCVSLVKCFIVLQEDNDLNFLILAFCSCRIVQEMLFPVLPLASSR